MRRADGPRSEGEFFGRPTLQTRGWTAALIARFLPDPDATAPNPHYKCAPPRKLYAKGRVEAIERTRPWKAARGKAAARQAAAGKAASTKRDRLERYVEELVIDVPKMPKDELILNACAHYNARQHQDDWSFRPATPESDRGFLGRIVVNYLRHRCTRYETELVWMHGKVGADGCAAALKRKVLAAIAAAYPELEHECSRQTERVSCP